MRALTNLEGRRGTRRGLKGWGWVSEVEEQGQVDEMRT